MYECTYQGQPCVLKHRLSKAYRHPTLDERLCKERLQGESRATARARRLGIPVPQLLLSDAASGCLVLECVRGPTVKAWLQAGGAQGPFADAVACHVGCTIARLHACGLAHGDLTTSNMMLRGSSSSTPWGGDGGGERDPWGLAALSRGAGGGGGGGASSASALQQQARDPADEPDEAGGGGVAGGGGGGEGCGAGEEDLLLGLSGLGTGGGGAAEACAASGGGGGGGGGGEAATAACAPCPEPATAAPAPPVPPAPALPALPSAVSECVLIDFGLACQNASLEDMGVDLYVLERALTSAHARDATRLFAVIFGAYTEHLGRVAPPNHHGAAAVAGKFAAVRSRGRKRVAFG